MQQQYETDLANEVIGQIRYGTVKSLDDQVAFIQTRLKEDRKPSSGPKALERIYRILDKANAKSKPNKSKVKAFEQLKKVGRLSRPLTKKEIKEQKLTPRKAYLVNIQKELHIQKKVNNIRRKIYTKIQARSKPPKHVMVKYIHRKLLETTIPKGTYNKIINLLLHELYPPKKTAPKTAKKTAARPLSERERENFQYQVNLYMSRKPENIIKVEKCILPPPYQQFIKGYRKLNEHKKLSYKQAQAEVKPIWAQLTSEQKNIFRTHDGLDQRVNRIIKKVKLSRV